MRPWPRRIMRPPDECETMISFKGDGPLRPGDWGHHAGSDYRVAPGPRERLAMVRPRLAMEGLAVSDETCGWRRDETFLPCGLPPGHEGGHRPAIPKPTTCGWCWGTHGCLDLPAGHDGDHECRMPVCDDDGTEVGYEVCDTRPQGHLDLFHMHWGEGRGIEYLDPVKQAESDRISARMRFTEDGT